MNIVKCLALGSAAGLIVVSGAQAADLPVNAKAVEYVKVCSLYGPGFYYIPGSDTCIKLGGYVRVDVLANTNSDATGNTGLPAGANNRFTNGYTWRSRGDLNVDTRTATEYGLLRVFFDATFSWTTDSYTNNPNAAAPGSSIYSAIGGGAAVSPASAPNNANAGAVAGGAVGVNYAFLQFAGFTIGKAISQFSAPWTNYPANSFDGLVGGGGAILGVNQFTYTAEFGSGLSLSLSAQDPTTYYQAGVNNLSAGGAYGTSDYAGTISPDFVAMLRVDQPWGLLQASIAAHDNHAAYYGAAELTGHPDDKWGWAGQLALSIKNIPTGPGDTVNLNGVYTDGATRYNIQDLAGQAGAAQVYGGTSLPGIYQSVGIGVAPDTIFAAGTQQQTIKTWGFRGGYTHNWDPYWNTGIYGAYAAIMYNDTAKTLLCGVSGSVRTVLASAPGTGITSCNPDYNVAQVGVITRWTPVKNLTFSADVTYTHLDQKYAGVVAAPSASLAKPAALYELKDQDTVTMLLRAQRNW
ncbi:porin [Bradyrhizobium sp. Pha-3]|uniref:porin n=1 Tax=Bradyrhizobium sp. Pha-3 TaxID=208375 RepID=UPI0035D47C07